MRKNLTYCFQGECHVRKLQKLTKNLQKKQASDIGNVCIPIGFGLEKHAVLR